MKRIPVTIVRTTFRSMHDIVDHPRGMRMHAAPDESPDRPRRQKLTPAPSEVVYVVSEVDGEVEIVGERTIAA